MMKRLRELWIKVDDRAVEIVSSVAAAAIWHLWVAHSRNKEK